MNYLLLLLVNSLYLLAVINPLSKVALISMGRAAEEKAPLFPLVLKSTIVGGALLYSVIIFGEAILNRVFHVELYSLRVAGGIVLSTVGFQALKTGMFFGHDNHSRFGDLAIVPLACPMIAGPASMTAVITLSIETSVPLTLIAVTVALALNLAVMAFSGPITAVLSRYNILGAFIRITGLIVMTIGVQMIFGGISGWLVTAPL